MYVSGTFNDVGETFAAKVARVFATERFKTLPKQSVACRLVWAKNDGQNRCAAMAVGPLENDAKQNGAGGGASSDERRKRQSPTSQPCLTMTTTTTTSDEGDKKSILSKTNRQQANREQQSNITQS